MKYILYIAFHEKYVNEIIYSIQSMIQTMMFDTKEYRIVIFTNCAEKLEKVYLDSGFVTIEKISDDTLQEWMGKNHFIFRAKIKVFEYFFQQYGQQLAILLDSDTLVMDRLDELFDELARNNFVMYAKCTSISNALQIADAIPINDMSVDTWERIYCYRDLIEKKQIIVGDEAYPVHANMQFYNSSIVGMNGVYHQLVKKIIDLMEYLYERYPYGKTTAEEMAFSWVFQENGQVIPCDDKEIIYHYSEARFCKYIAGYLLDCLQEDDSKCFEQVLKENGIDDLEGYNLSIRELPLFMQYILSEKSKAFESLNLQSLEEAYTYIDINTPFYKRNLDVRKFMKFVKAKRLNNRQRENRGEV